MRPVFRNWLKTLEENGLMKRIRKPVNPVFELACIGKKLEPQFGAYFENVRGHDIPVVTGLTTTRDIMAMTLGMTYPNLKEKFNAALERPVPCEIVSGGKYAVKENICVGDEVDLTKLPAPTHHEKDSNPYLTGAMCIVRDPETGIRNACIHRHEVRDKNHLGALLLPRHTLQIFNKLEARGKDLEIALVIGVHPAILLASQATTPLGVDELEIASSLLDEPLQMIRCETVDLEVPVECEFVLEGKIVAGARAEEGPFGEYPKTYGPKAKRHLLEISAITHRNNPIYHTIIPSTMEHLLLGGISREATMMTLLRQASSNVKDVRLTTASGCRYHVVVQIDPEQEGEAKNAMFAALASSTEVKHVIAVNSDINIDDMQDVEWAMANRAQAGRDIFIITDAQGNRLDPSSRNGTSDKMGIDATIPVGGSMEKFEKIRIPGYDTVHVEEYL
ncbi:MAG: UbiD family decarboxylase [Desulfovibrio sp.]|jgi:2,5-furandicarboxylate decarboxylase 1|nr:UbiD family decarboxylase [Desulfovibrio sp.]